MTNLGNLMNPDGEQTLTLTVSGKDALPGGYYKNENKKTLTTAWN